MRLDHLLSKENVRKDIILGQRGMEVWLVMLFNFEGPCEIRGCSSVGRAPALHAGGQEFEPPHLHQKETKESAKIRANSSAG